MFVTVVVVVVVFASTSTSIQIIYKINSKLLRYAHHVDSAVRKQVYFTHFSFLPSTKNVSQNAEKLERHNSTNKHKNGKQVRLKRYKNARTNKIRTPVVVALR